MKLNEFLTGIANAIRYVEGSTAPIPAPDYAARIIALSGSGGGGGEAGDTVLVPLHVTENGVYIPGEGANGFNYVTVDVAGTLERGVVVNAVDADGNWTDIAIYGDVPANAFAGNAHLQSVSIVNATRIGDRAFYGCAGIIDIAIPDSVAAIGDFAFASMAALTSAQIGTSEACAIAEIGENAFSSNDNLATIQVHTTDGFVAGSPWGSSAEIVWVYGVPEPPIVQLEYIESDGASYIDTGILAQSGLTVTLDAQYISTDRYQALFGGKDSSEANRLSVYYHTGKMYFYYASDKYPYATVAYQERHVYSTVDNIFYVDGVQTISNTAATFIGAHNIAIFACNTGGTIEQYAKARLHSMQIEKDGVLIRDYIPALYENTVGLYDRVTQEFYVNNGTGVLTAGPEIKE